MHTACESVTSTPDSYGYPTERYVGGAVYTTCCRRQIAVYLLAAVMVVLQVHDCLAYLYLFVM